MLQISSMKLGGEFLDKYILAKTVHNQIMAFLNEKELDSKQTRTSYESDIRLFFQIMLDKQIEELVPADLVFENSHILEYKLELARHYAANSVNRKIASVRSLMKYLAKDYPEIRYDVFEQKRMKGETNHYGILTWDEVAQMIELVKAHNNGMQKSLAIELAARTAFRIDALVNLKWENFEKQNDEFVIVRVYDKGKSLDEKPIPMRLYEDLLANKTDNIRVFTLTVMTFQRAITQLVKEMGINPARHITFHSIKKMGINFALEQTGDITIAAKHGNHKNIQTTYASIRLEVPPIQKFTINYKDMPGYTMGTSIEFEILYQLSWDQLIEIIKDTDDCIKYQLIKLAKSKFGVS